MRDVRFGPMSIELSLTSSEPLISVNANEFYAAGRRCGIPTVKSRPYGPSGIVFEDYPRWALVAFWAGGEAGLAVLNRGGTDAQASVESALALGGRKAVEDLIRQMSLEVPDALVPPGFP